MDTRCLLINFIMFLQQNPAVRDQKVAGSNPVTSTSKPLQIVDLQGLFIFPFLFAACYSVFFSSMLYIVLYITLYSCCTKHKQFYTSYTSCGCFACTPYRLLKYDRRFMRQNLVHPQKTMMSFPSFCTTIFFCPWYSLSVYGSR